MAKNNSINTGDEGHIALTDGKARTLAQEISMVFSPAYEVEALLDGALALLERNDDDLEPRDCASNAFNARQIIEVAMAKAKSIYLLADELAVVAQAEELEAV